MGKAYYIYAHLEPESNGIFYIGKGTGKRILSNKRNKYWEEYIEYLNGDYKTLIIKDRLTEKEALVLEQKIINKLKNIWEGGTLLNIDKRFNPENSISISFSFEDGLNLNLGPDPKENFKYYEKIKERSKYISLSDDEICSDLLNFPYSAQVSKLESDFRKLYDELDTDQYLQESDDRAVKIEDLLSEYEEIYDLVSDLKSGSLSIIEFKNKCFEIICYIEQNFFGEEYLVEYINKLKSLLKEELNHN